jgi:uncharacterized repeat protein (TIGR01451 family)
VIGQATDDPATRYFVPTGGGKIVGWQVNTTGATAGQSVTLVVLRNSVFNSYQVVGTDAKTLPNPLPSNHIASFTVTTPITVQDGDTFGLYTNSNSGLSCYWSGGSTPLGDSLTALTEASSPASGQTLNPAFGNSPSGYTMNLAATLSVSVDAGVTTGTSPASPAAGTAALLASTVTNHGPGQDAIAFQDTVPSGLTIVSASVGDGTCATSGQVVTCTITGLPPGGSVPANVVVTSSAPGNYVNQVSVAVPPEDTDAVSSNNTASATLSVGPIGLPAKCVVPPLKGVASGTAKTVLKDLGCRVKAVSSHSKSVHKGSVIKTKPGRGTYAYQRVITLVVSSGPKKHHK